MNSRMATRVTLISFSFVGLLLALLSATLYAATPAQNASAIYRIEPGSRTLRDPKAYNVDFGIHFTPPSGAKVVRIWLPKPISTEDQLISNFHYLTQPTAEGTEPLYGNQFLYYEYHNPTGPVEPRVGYTVIKYAERTNIDPTRVWRPKVFPPEFQKYLRSEQRVTVNDSIRTLAQQIAGDEKNPYILARKFFLWITDNIKYGHEDMAEGVAGCTLQADSMFVYKNRRGHCSDWHGFFVALCRSVGIPARINYGVEVSDKKRVSPSHCRAEVFLAGYGWVNMDITHGRYGKTDEERLKEFGYIANDWYRNTVGSDYPFVPATSATWPDSYTGTNPPLIRIAYIEVDGKAWTDPDPANPKNQGKLDKLNYHTLWDFREIPLERAFARDTQTAALGGAK